MNPLEISVIVSTYNAEEWLEKVLWGFEIQTYRNFELIIADEPTGNLDPETAIEVMDLFEELHRKGNTVILATHDYRLIKKYNHPVIRCENQGIHKVEPVGS